MGEWKLVSNNIIAILLGILANSIKYLGLALAKHGASKLPEIEEQSFWQNVKNFAKCKIWFLGFSLTIIQWFPLMVAIKLGSLSVVAPTIAVGFIVLIIFSWFYLKEPIRLLEIISIVVVIIAIIVLNTIAPVESNNYDIVEINGFLKESKAIIFLCLLALFIFILVLVTYNKRFSQAGALIAISSGFSFGLAIIFAKAAIGSLTFDNALDFLKSSLVAWQWWIYITLMCLFYAIAFITQQMSFQKGKAIVVAPTTDVMNIIVQVTAGIFVFDEWLNIWGDLEAWKKTLKTTSIIIIIFSIVLLSFLTAKDLQQERFIDASTQNFPSVDEPLTK